MTGAAMSTASPFSPKLPAYFRTHHTAWQRNENTRKAVAVAASGEAELDRISAETL